MRMLANLAARSSARRPPFAADPGGRYEVNDSNPGGGLHCRGISVSCTWHTCRVIWLTGRTRYVSTGIDDKNLFAVPYRARNSTKFALYGADGDS